MWKNFYLLSLILFTINFPPDRFARAEPIRLHSELDARDDDYDYRRDTHGRRARNDEPLQQVVHVDESSSELVGKWRSNGEALEPKWRDGDTVPLLPFSHFSRYSRDDVDGNDFEKRRGPHYRDRAEHDGYTRLLSNDRTSQPDSYEYFERFEDRRNKHGDRNKNLHRAKGNRPSSGPNVADGPIFLETGTRNDDNKEYSRGSAESKDITSTRYREAFQVRPNDYEHELNDEEYLKPRPRKRRPPQNYEFALAANEAMLREKKPENASRAGSRSNVRGNASTSTSRNEGKGFTQPPFAQNMELKSLLKMQQEEGLSLSEILQRRNLTLNDLLRGKADAINVLKSKDFEEVDEYEEASRTMSSSFAKISTTEKPQWTSISDVRQMKNVKKDNERLTLNDAYSGKLLLRNTPALIQRGVSPDSEITTSSILDRFKLYSETENVIIEKATLRNLDPLPTKIATFATMSTVVTTPTPPDSMEFFQSDDSNVRIQNSGEIKSDVLDEDEIMEFSDFTDYKKGRNSASTVWLMMKDDERTESPVKNIKSEHEGTGSTLSIEQILSPTERTKPSENSSMISRVEEFEKYQPSVQDDRMSQTKDKITVIERPTDHYTIFFEHEYQDDAPITNDDLTNNDTSVTSDNKDNSGMSLMEEIQSALDSMENKGRRPIINHTSSPKELLEGENENRNLKNHQDSHSKDKRYEDIVSEVEPEARAEIFELFASGSAAKRLERLLKSRNMSVEELIALRQRGSSKVHLAEVSRLRTQKTTIQPRPQSESNTEVTTSILLEEDVSEVGSKDTETHENRQTSANKASYNTDDSELSESFLENKAVNSWISNSMDSVHVEEDVTEESMTDRHNDSDNVNYRIPLDSDGGSANCKQDAKEENSRHMVQIADLLTTFASLPFAKDIRQNITAEITDYADLTKKKFQAETIDSGAVHANNDVGTTRPEDTPNIVHSGYVEEVVKEDSNFVTTRTAYGEINDNFSNEKHRNEGSQTLSKVKPSIIASGAILGVTVVVFLAILITCRIKQKQKYRYRSSFSRAVFQGPVATSRKLSNSSSLSTVMVNVVATSTTKRPERNEHQEVMGDFDPKSDIDNDSLDANDSWETIPDYMK